MTCILCERRGKTWQGSNPTCAFKDGTFSPDNWNCATMGTLRDLADLFDMSHRCGDDSIGIVPFEGAFIVMAWYKSRGKTDRAYALGIYGEPKSVSTQDAHMAIRQFYNFDMLYKVSDLEAIKDPYKKLIEQRRKEYERGMELAEEMAKHVEVQFMTPEEFGVMADKVLEDMGSQCQRPGCTRQAAKRVRVDPDSWHDWMMCEECAGSEAYAHLVVDD